MNRSHWFFHPISVFIFSILALALSLFLYIYWYIEVSSGLRALVYKFNLDTKNVFASETWVVILVLSILVGIILLGILIIFIYSQKAFQLYRLQENFISSFTHELKTPVTSIKLYLETFLKYDLPRRDQSKYIDYMLKDVGRLSENIDRILSIARLESRNYGGEFVQSELVSTVKSFCQKSRHLFPGCDIRVEHPPGFEASLPINQALFEMLLMNLLSNAVKYNNSTTPSVMIRFVPNGKKLIIHFEDNGVGLEPRELKRVFRKFYQVGNSENMSAKGSGLGLYLAQQVARFHKGKLLAKSPGVGKGSHFSLMLPHG